MHISAYLKLETVKNIFCFVLGKKLILFFNSLFTGVVTESDILICGLHF